MAEACLGYRKGNIMNAMKEINKGLKSKSCEEKDESFRELMEIMEDLTDLLLEKAWMELEK